MKEKIIFYRRDPVLTPVKEVMEKVKEFFPSSFTVVNYSLQVVFSQDNFVVFLDQTDLNVFTYTIAVVNSIVIKRFLSHQVSPWWTH